MRHFIAFLLLASPFVSSAQIGTGQWRMHIPASQAIDVAVGDGYVMAALSGGVLEYDIAASENRILNNMNALSDIEVTCITYEPQSQSFFVGYANGNLDQITNGNVRNIPAIKLANVTGSKRVNKIIVHGGKAYIATGFSVVLIDPVKSEVKDTYYPTNGNTSINDVVLLNDSIYVLTNTKMYRGLRTNAFLADPSQWTVDPRAPQPAATAHYGELALRQDEIYITRIDDSFGNDSIYHLTPAGLEFEYGGMEMTRFDIQEDLFYVYYTSAMIAFNDDWSVNFGVEAYGSAGAFPARVLPYQGLTWVADKANGLVRYGAGGSFTFIQREGPPKNQFFALNSAKGKIIATAGSVGRVVPSYTQPAAYAFEDESWKLYGSDQPAWQTGLTWDIGFAAIYSEDLNKIALAGYSKEPLSTISDGNMVDAVYSASNSPLEPTSLGNGNVCISAVEYDKKGNLWVVNCYSTKPLKVLKTDDTWEVFNGSPALNAFTGKLVIDSEDNKWFAAYDKGLVGFDGDSWVQLVVGKGDGNLPSNNVTAIAEDVDGEIWIGTDNGFAVLYNANSVFTGTGSKDASRILITFEGNVENLLGNTPITDIEIDGGNRKWIATASTGIFLLSSDGQEVIAQYTKENSPLISNNIMDMEFNHMTGELFIITDQGLVSLRTDSSVDDVNYESTTVFPNPVKPDYFGPITIQGIRYDSDVKITDVAGNVVYQTTSNGGTATWNGKTLNGDDVASGVYLIWTATNTGKDRKVGKVAVVR